MNNLSSSFKDPSGFVFEREGIIYRQINQCYKDNYDMLMNSGLYERLVKSGKLIAHEETESFASQIGAYKVLKPRQVPFISYPYEWCFGQLKDAALLTLRTQKEALSLGMNLKDATAFNVQFIGSQPIFIDTLSFEKYREGEPWVAYKQFCEHFLAPLALYAYTDNRLNKLSLVNIDGVPLDLAAKLLPLSAKFKPAIFLHIILHAKSQSRYAGSSLQSAKKSNFSKNAFLGLLDNLENFIKNLKWQGGKTVWTDYYDQEKCVSYDDAALTTKKELVVEYLDLIGTKKLWDVGANAGLFSRLAAEKNISVISMDYDSTVIEQAYLRAKQQKNDKILSLVVDIVNPTPFIGWHNRERNSICSRSLPDTVLALALIHHLAIGKNLPFFMIAGFFADISDNLIIEFVPKEDKQTQLLLQSREDIFEYYTIENFEFEFEKYFEIKAKKAITSSKRFLYLMRKKT